MINLDTTICAIATGTGGAISIIRVSGKECLDIVSKIFIPLDKSRNILDIKGFTIVFGEICHNGKLIDEALLSVFIAPNSYTGENCVEISCHASQYIERKILEALIANGATHAMPGEFTQRAFLNSKIDLSQAEAVADVIASASEMSHKVAINQMRGGFSAEIEKLRAELLNFISLIELELDFSEEDVEFADRNDLMNTIIMVKEATDKLSESFSLGNALRDGVPVVIAGKPNSGKSTLLNALLMEEKAIVSEIPGTTRDVIEDTIVIQGVEFRFIDTAGLRETTDIIESLGIKKTLEKVSQATVVVLVDEIGEKAKAINERINYITEKIENTGAKLITLINKCDLATAETIDRLRKEIKTPHATELMFISAQQKTGLDELKNRLADIVNNKFRSDSVIITNIRHYEALINISSSLERVIKGLEQDIPSDLVAIDIRQAIHYLGEITGAITTDEVLGNIFAKFCIGK